MPFLSPGEHIWIEPLVQEKRGEFEVAIGAVVVSSDATGILIRDDDKKVHTMPYLQSSYSFFPSSFHQISFNFQSFCQKKTRSLHLSFPICTIIYVF
jgi:hypothetical protein